jgi:hypothetical protein
MKKAGQAAGYSSSRESGIKPGFAGRAGLIPKRRIETTESPDDEDYPGRHSPGANEDYIYRRSPEANEDPYMSPFARGQ